MISPPITEVYKLIAKQDYDWLDLLASGNKAPDATGKYTSILIQNADETPDGIRNNRSTLIRFRIEIQIFFKKGFSQNIYEKRQVIEDLLQDDGWILSDERPPVPDPKTQQTFMTIYLIKNYRRK